jgi:Rrf2 family protein
MIKISKKSQYGLRAMVFLAKYYKKKEVCSTKTISLKEGVPFDFLEKIISKLEKAKLVEGRKGVLGGYILSKSPKKISVYDIVSVLEENKKPVNCDCCNRIKKCSAKNVWAKLENSLNKTLKSVTLIDLIK